MSRDIWEYDPTSDKWTIITQYPGEAIHEVAGFCVNNKIYIAAGYKPLQDEPGTNINTCYYLEKEVWEYDLVGKSWTKKNNIPTPMSGDCSKHEPINLASGISSGDTGFLLFQLKSTNRNQLWRYEPVSDTWSPVSVSHVGSKKTNVTFTINADVYIGSANSTFWKKYNKDSKVDTSYFIKSFPGEEGGTGVAFSINGKGYVFINKGEFWEYTP